MSNYTWANNALAIFREGRNLFGLLGPSGYIEETNNMPVVGDVVLLDEDSERRRRQEIAVNGYLEPAAMALSHHYGFLDNRYLVVHIEERGRNVPVLDLCHACSEQRVKHENCPSCGSWY